MSTQLARLSKIVSGFGPHEGFRIVVPGIGPRFDVRFEFFDAVAAATEFAVGQFAEHTPGEQVWAYVKANMELWSTRPR